MNYTLPKNNKELSVLIASAIGAAQSMRDKVQQAAVGILYHAYKHGDWTKANDLVDGLGHGVKRDSLVAFFVRFGGLTVSEEDKAFTAWKGTQHIKDNFDEAKSKMWYDFKKVNPFQGYSLEAELQKLMKRHTTMVKKAASMSEEEQALVKTTASQATIDALLSIAGFDEVMHTVGQDDIDAQIAAELAKAA